MCYAGGPYCYGPAKKKLTEAAAAYKQDKSYESYAILQDAREQLDGTRKGQQDLKKAIESLPEGDKKHSLIDRKERAAIRRKKDVAEAKNREGYNKEGYDSEGYNRDGYNKDGYDKDGYDRHGYNKDGYDKDGYDRHGYNTRGFDRDGYNREWLP